MSKFKIGDRVISSEKKGFNTNGVKGVVVDIRETKSISSTEIIERGVWVDFDYSVGGWDLEGLSKDDYGLIMDEDELELLIDKTRGFEVVSDTHRKSQGEIILPTRGTSKSAGYDFYSPIDIEIQPNQKVCIWSDVKAYMQEGEVLLLFVRSSIGIKRGLRLSNSTGVVDSDYFSNEDNDGNIGIALHNYTDKVVTIEKGERVCQGVFVPFLVADNGNTDIERNGGIGSTN